MAPIDSKLKGLLPETRYQFQGIRIRQNHKWITKFQCVYPNCVKRKLKSIGGDEKPRLESTSTQVFTHAMRYHRASASDEILTHLPTSEKHPLEDKQQQSWNGVSAPEMVSKFNSKKLKPLDDWTLLM